MHTNTTHTTPLDQFDAVHRAATEVLLLGQRGRRLLATKTALGYTGLRELLAEVMPQDVNARALMVTAVGTSDDIMWSASGGRPGEINVRGLVVLSRALGLEYAEAEELIRRDIVRDGLFESYGDEVLVTLHLAWTRAEEDDPRPDE
jgi:hypothetical protein